MAIGTARILFGVALLGAGLVSIAVGCSSSSGGSDGATPDGGGGIPGGDDDAVPGDDTSGDDDDAVDGGGSEAGVAIPKPVQISHGNSHRCALGEDGTVWCSGANTVGQLGNGTKVGSPGTPVQVVGLTDAVSVGAGSNHSCAAKADGTVVCWGNNSLGELGDGTNTRSQVPVKVMGITNAVKIFAGLQVSCAILGDGTARCWGSNAGSKLGNGSSVEASSNVPTSVSGLTTVVSIAISDYFGCAVLADGTARCWGNDGVGGRLGTGASTGVHATPVSVVTLTTAKTVAVSPRGACALLADASVRCWGGNEDNELGTTLPGGAPSTPTPVVVPALTNVVALTGGNSHKCALLDTGGVRCWGRNTLAQHGNGAKTPSETPTTVTGVSNIVSVSAGESATCAVAGNGGVRCWGTGPLESLGDGTTRESAVAIPIGWP